MSDHDRNEFTQEAFVRFMAHRYQMTHIDAYDLYSEIGKSITKALQDGSTVRVFGIGTLKVVYRNNANKIKKEKRVRFNPSVKLKGIVQDAHVTNKDDY